MARLAQQRGAKGHRVRAGRGGGFVHETFLEEGLVRVAHRTPETHRHRQLDGYMADARVRAFVGLVEGAFGGGLVRAGRGQAEDALEHLRRDRLAGRRVVPGHELALRVEARP